MGGSLGQGPATEVTHIGHFCFSALAVQLGLLFMHTQNLPGDAMTVRCVRTW